MTSDPYKIAFLRGSEEETVRIAVVNLIDRGLLGVVGSTLKTTNAEGADMLRRPLDKETLACCATRSPLETVLKNPRVRAACAGYARELQDAGLLRGEFVQGKMNMGLFAVLGLLGGIALARILQALSHGRSAKHQL